MASRRPSPSSKPKASGYCYFRSSRIANSLRGRYSQFHRGPGGRTGHLPSLRGESAHNHNPGHGDHVAIAEISIVEVVALITAEAADAELLAVRAATLELSAVDVGTAALGLPAGRLASRNCSGSRIRSPTAQSLLKSS